MTSALRAESAVSRARPIAPKGDASPGALRLLRAASALLVRAIEWTPISPLGALLAAGAYGVLTRFARVEQDLVWLVSAYAALALCAVGPLAVLLGALAVALGRRRGGAAPRLLLETESPAETGFALRRPWYLPLVQLSWRWAAPEGVVLEPRATLTTLHERVVAGTRGRFEQVERRVTVSDAFGLARVVLRLREARAVDVLPRLGALRHMPELQSFASGDARPHPLGLSEGDRVELRRYQGGDPARFIHWKVLARTRKLMVRVPERALSVAHRSAAFLVAGAGDDASAACARLALERGLLGHDWVFGTDAEPEGTSRLDAALGALMQSGAAQGEGGRALEAFALNAARKGPVSLIVFAPPTPGAWLGRVAEVARRHRPVVVIGVDGVQPRSTRSWLARLIAFAEPSEHGVAEDLDEVVRTLAAAGARVGVVDRSTGRPLSDLHRAGMRALEARAA